MAPDKIRATPLVALALFVDVCSGANQAIWLTAIQPFTGADWDGGISIRIGAEILQEEVNNNPSLLPGYELKIVWQDGMCAKGVGTQVFLENLFDKKYTVFAPGKNISELDRDGSGVVTTADVAPFEQIWGTTQVNPPPVGLLGSGCAGTAMNIANIAYMARFPIVSNSATRPALSDRSQYPNFFRTIMPDTFFNDAWINMARQLNMTQVGTVIGEIENWGSMGSVLVNAALTQGVQLVGNDLTQDVPNFYGMKVSLDSQTLAKDAAGDLVKYKMRVVILLMFHRRNRLVLCEAFKVNYFNAVYLPMGWLPFGWWEIPDTDCTPASLTDMAKYFISANMMFWRADGNTRLSCSTSMTSAQFQAEWFRRQGGTFGDLSMRPEGYAPATEAATSADAVCMYAQMLHEVLINRGVPLSDLTDRTPNGYSNVFDALSNMNFEGVQGTVRFLPGLAEPLGSVIMQQLQEVPGGGGSLRLLDVASYKHPQMTYLGLGDLKFQFPGETYFAGPTGANSIPAGLTTFKVCVNQVLDMRTNLCVNCPQDTQYVQRSQACLCVAGYYRTSSGCQKCPAGTMSTAPGTIQCTSCAVGKYSPEGSTACTFCPRGKYSDAIGLGVCRSCPNVTTTPDIAAESINECVCEQGAFQNGTRCDYCPATAFTNGINAQSINECLCPKDTYMENSVCTACPRGSDTHSATGQTSIFGCRCERDMYLSNGLCVNCPNHSSTESPGKTHVKSCLCKATKYMPKDARTCLDCPKGMVCPKGSSENNWIYISSLPNSNPEQQYMTLEKRFWASLSKPMSVFECRSGDKCPGTSTSYPGRACAANLLNGQACEFCEVGYHWTGQVCEECSGFEKAPFLFPILPIMLSIVLIIVMYKFFADSFHKWSSWKNGVFTLAFILLNFFQTVDIVGNTNIVMPSVTKSIFNVWAVTNNMAAIFKLDCMGWTDATASIVMRGITPPILAVLCFLTFCVAWVLSQKIKIERLYMEPNQLMNVYLTLIFTFYNSILAFSLVLFKCSDNPNGTQSLGVDLSIICFSSAEWTSLIAAGVIFILFYVIGIFAAFLRVTLVAPKLFGDLAFQMRWKFLFIKFRADAYWWGLVWMFKNFMINISFVITASGIIQLYLTMAWTTFYMCTLVFVTPYRHRVASGLDVSSTLCILYVSALLTGFADRDDIPSIFNSVDVTTGIISLLPACTAIFCVAHLARYGYNSPPSKRELAQAHKDFEDVVSTFNDLCHLSTEEGATVILEIGEWDRRYLRQAMEAIKTDVLGHQSALRVANTALSKRVNSRVTAVKTSKEEETGGSGSEAAAAKNFVNV